MTKKVKYRRNLRMEHPTSYYNKVYMESTRAMHRKQKTGLTFVRERTYVIKCVNVSIIRHLIIYVLKFVMLVTNIGLELQSVFFFLSSERRRCYFIPRQNLLLHLAKASKIRSQWGHTDDTGHTAWYYKLWLLTTEECPTEILIMFYH